MALIDKLLGTEADEKEEKKMDSFLNSAKSNEENTESQDEERVLQKPSAGPINVSSQTAQKKMSEQKEDQDAGDNFLTDVEGQLTLDVYQTDSEIVIKSTIAGVKPEDIDISINNDMITIKGTRVNEDEVHEEDYFYQECYWGTFSRSVILPVEVDVDNIKAAIKDGILTVRLPKLEKVQTKKISVKAG